MQRFGRKAVYIVIGDGVEEEQGAKKVLPPRALLPSRAGPGFQGPCADSSASRCRRGPSQALAGRPFAFAHRRSILSNFLQQIPLRAFGCRPW